MRRLVFSLCLLTFLGSSAIGQQRPDLSRADRFARSVSFPVRDRHSLDSLIGLVEQGFGFDEEKIRAMFTWVATNLEYDCGNDTSMPLRSVSIEQVLRSGRSQCAGYSNLLQYTLRKMGFEAVTIKGVAKTAKKDLWWTERDLKPNHAWNAVKLGGEWKLLDATWASGAADDDCNTIIREFSPFYFFPDPGLFQLSHLPTDTAWQLLTQKMAPGDFLRIPVFHDPYYDLRIRSFAPVSGVIELDSDQSVDFVFQSDLPLEKIAIWCEENNQIKPEFGSFRKNGISYSYTYKIKSPGNYFLNIAINGMKTSMVYYVKVRDRRS